MTARYRERRDIAERLVLRCALVLQEPAHLGGADPDATSTRPILRDPDGNIYLAGTALKGVLRGGSSAAWLFGDAEKNQARLIVDDARLAAEVVTEVRDGVALDPELGIAAHGKKYDIELLPAGSRFDAAFEALIPQTDGVAVLQELVAALAKLDDGVEVGARTRRGFGRLRREGPWSLRRYRGAAGLRAWLAEGLEGAPEAWRATATEHERLDVALGVQSALHTQPQAVRIALELKLTSSILIRSPVAGTGAADTGHLHAARSGGASIPVLSGTSLAGALRARCRRIARTLLSDGPALDLVNGLFGPERIESQGASSGSDSSQSRSAFASRLRVGEAGIEGTRTLRHTRVRIDPWTGGAADTLLFTSEPVYLGRVCPVLHWSKPPAGPDPAQARARERAERALLLLALRDLVLGDLHLGGEGGTGRGRVAPFHDDGRFGSFGETVLRLTETGGLDGDFSSDLDALKEWSHARDDTG